MGDIKKFARFFLVISTSLVFLMGVFWPAGFFYARNLNNTLICAVLFSYVLLNALDRFLPFEMEEVFENDDQRISRVSEYFTKVDANIQKANYDLANRYLAKVKTLINEIKSEKEIVSEYKRQATLYEAVVTGMKAKKYPYEASAFEAVKKIEAEAINDGQKYLSMAGYYVYMAEDELKEKRYDKALYFLEKAKAYLKSVDNETIDKKPEWHRLNALATSYEAEISIAKELK